LEALWLVSSELVRRMNEHFASDKDKRGGRGGGGAGGKEAEEPFRMVYQEPLPLADFFGCIDEHFEVRAVLWGAVLCCAVLCCAVLCCALLSCAVVEV
jgi:hypothetical protein